MPTHATAAAVEVHILFVESPHLKSSKPHQKTHYKKIKLHPDEQLYARPKYTRKSNFKARPASRRFWDNEARHLFQKTFWLKYATV